MVGRASNPRISPDGKWVYYIQIVGENDPAQIRKVSIDGGDPSVLATWSESDGAYTLLGLDVSPLDGSVAYIRASYKVDHWKYELIIMPPHGGSPLKTIELPPTTSFRLGMRWTPDGKSIAFNDSRNGGANIWSIPIDGPSVAKPLTSFTTPQTFGFHWSRDGKQLLVGRGSSSSEAVLISRKE